MNIIIFFLSTLLKFFYQYTNDFGIAIICLTVSVKLCMLPIQIRQRRSIENQQANAGSCLLLLLQFPIMIGLYHSIAAGMTAEMGTKLLPWVTSLLVRDRYGVLPVVTVFVQTLPQLYPYLSFFQSLKLPKPAPGMILSTTIMMLMICFPLPSGVGLYYLTSSLFTALEQGVWNMMRVRKMQTATLSSSLK